jgi:hypothetical protein
MTAKNYADLIAQLPNNTTNDISPTDVREIVESFARQRTIGTYSNASVATTTTFAQAPVVQYGSAVTNGITWVSNHIKLRDNNIRAFAINYSLQGEFTNAGVVRTRLMYGLAGAAPTLELPLSGLSFEAAGGNPFSISKYYEIPAAGVDTTIAIEWKTDAIETISNLEVFLNVFSLPPTYGGA